MKILTVVGARPQFIKAATVSRALKTSTDLTEIIVHTGQHFDSSMSDVFFEQMDIPRPNHHLDISGLDHGAMTGRMLEGIERLIKEEKPDWVLVYGDTNSTLAGALAASKLHIPLAHVEAGLRSFNMHMPEEINRVLTDRVSSVLFCPTEQAIKNLEKEGYAGLPVDIKKVGDVMQDAAMYYRSRARKPEVDTQLPDCDYVLATVHRAENTDDPERLSGIVRALNAIHQDYPVVLPLHPRTRQRLEAYGLNLDVHLIEPVGYLEMIWLLDNAGVVMTDSGGLQKEAYFFSSPCVTLRDETEWVELVDKGINRLAGANYDSILTGFGEMKSVEVIEDNNLYGGGKAAQEIVNYFVK